MKQCNHVTMLLVLLFLGLVIRFFFIGNPGFEADIAYWKSWSLAASDHGPLWTVTKTNYNYPPVFVYLLWVLGKIYDLFANPHDFNHYWQNTNFLYLFLAKLIPILSDLGIAILLFFLGKKIVGSRSLPLLMAGLYLFNPVSIFDGSVWGQVDSLGLAFFLLSLILLYLKKPLLSSAIFTLSFLLKLQNIIYIPIFFLFIFLRFGQKTFFKSLATAGGAFFVFCFEYFLKNQGPTILRLVLQNADWFPYLSLNAYNLWWIVSGANGMGVSDRILTFGILNAKTLGLILFSGSYLLCLGILFTRRFENLILACLLAVFSFYLLLTQAHERYIFPAIVFMILLLPACHPERSEGSRSFGLQPQDDNRHTQSSEKNPVSPVFWWSLFIVLSLVSFYNLHNAFVHFYPQNGLPIISNLNLKVLTVAVSVVNIGLFGVLLFEVVKRIHFFFPLASLGFISFSLFFLNSNYLFKKEVSLTSFKPIRQVSSFAPCQKNRSVNSNFGWKYWNRLSVNYFFYEKGFGCHAHSELEFDLDKKFKKFATDFGVDTEADVNSSVVFKIYGDEKLLFQSEKMGRFDLPKHVEVDVKGVKTLTLAIVDAGDGNRDDHGDWLNPVLYRE